MSDRRPGLPDYPPETPYWQRNLNAHVLAADLMAAALRDRLESDEDFRRLYRETEAEDRESWTFTPAPLFEEVGA